MDFIDDFIQEYKNNPCLWKADSVNYKNRTKRQEAYMKLIDVAAKHGEHYNVERTKQKINNLRCAFRHQLKKYNELKSKGEKEEPYCPKRKYFESLMFLKDEETRDKRLKQDHSFDQGANIKAENRLLSSETESVNTELCETDKHTGASINGVTVDTIQVVPNNLFTDICKEIHKDNGGGAEMEDDLNSEANSGTLLLDKDSNTVNISVISEKGVPLTQEIEEIAITPVRKEHVFIVDTGTTTTTHHISNTPSHKQTSSKSRKRSSSFSSQHSNETDNTTPIKTNKSDITLDLEQLLTLACKNFQKNSSDHYTSFGDIVAHKLRSMDTKQAIYAEKIISDILYQGQMKLLSTSTIERFSQIEKQCNNNSNNV
ncbi:uncharacterized protein LOC119636205 [Glossina fuscipes]|uniref:Uncharacterized protein LOC119636205 n=2 Tax=Nemorhina TaxID=44051 RepID=A0A9C5Z0S0_9MUSC|nr:uncharacterized protein LOC119636205 [Glossina fuscipes]KAI9582746.1 hypothetical protein GQX74_011963 [Glossina fuscipes]